MRRAAAVLLPLAGVFVLALLRIEGPDAKPGSAPPTAFSADRALGTIRTVLAEGIAHPIGTAANHRVRDRIVARFRELGYETSVQSRFACNAAATCGAVENILARQPGTRRADAVLLTAHYDSVGAGMGASDDGQGIATALEAARALRGQRFRNPVAFLITDGEEAGLLGAEAFIAEETLRREVGVIINVEMRGTHGASNMFETSRGNLWLVRHLSRALERPNATSLFFTIYDLLPNDTDVSIFKRAGAAAINFAAIRGVNWYHTPYDDLEHFDPRTLQHHGDNVLASARALASADLAARGGGDATYFDVLGFHLIWWPQSWTLWIAVGGLLLLVTAARKTPPREVTFGVLTAFTTVLLSVGLGLGLSWLTRLRSGGANFVARPEPAVAAMWLGGIAGALFAAALFRRRAHPRAMLLGIAIVWQVIGIALALTLPGVAFLFVVPALVASVLAVAGAGEIAIGSASSTAGAILFFPMALLLHDALGGTFLVAIAIAIGTLASLAAPLFGSMRAAGVVALLALGCAVAGTGQPPYTLERPRRISITHLDDGRAQWRVPALTADLRVAAPFALAKDAVDGESWSTPGPPVAPRVILSGVRTGNRLVIRVRSARGADRLSLLLRGDARVVRVNGVAPPPRPARFRERWPAGWHSAVANGVDEMTVEWVVKGPVEARASDLTFGISPSATRLMTAREYSPAVPSQDGDVTITRAWARF